MDYPKTNGLHQGKFTDGFPVEGIPPSIDSAEHMNAVYDELINAIKGGGLTEDHQNLSQLSIVLDAIRESANYARDVIREAINGHNITPDENDLSQLKTILLSHAIPTGSVISVTNTTPPSGWVECNGAELSRTTYQNLFDVVGTSYGEGDGTTTFNLPDLRGEFIRGWDSNRGIDPDRAINSWQEDMLKKHQHGITATSNKGHPDGSGDRTGNYYLMFINGDRWQGGKETRPRNIALMYCIKY